MLLHSLAWPHPRAKSRGSGCKPYYNLFCYKICCSSNQIAERLITAFQLRSHAHKLKRVMKIKAIAQTVVKELGYRQLKPEQADVIEAFVKGRDVFACTANWLWQKPLLRTGFFCRSAFPRLLRSLHSSAEAVLLLAFSLRHMCML